MALLVTSFASAGTLLLSGDVNIAQATVGGGGFVLPNDNDTFFLNVLGTGTQVRILSVPLPGALEVTDLDSFYDGVGGVTSSLIVGPITAADLAGADLLVIILPDAAFAAGEIAAMTGFLAGGGTLFFMGDYGVGEFSELFAPSNAAINSALAALGSGMSIVPDAIDSGPHVSTPLIHPLTAGVSNFQYAYTSRVSGGTPLYPTSSGAQSFLAVEEITSVPEPTSSALTFAGVVLLLIRRLSRPKR